jgi:hypothetical protein
VFKAAVRVNKMRALAQLRGATLHAQRHDETGQLRVREGAVAGTGLAWSKAENPRDYLAAFRAHKAELHAGERKGAPLALQVLCVVSPEWVQTTGGLHDPDNPRNRQLFDQARAWAEGWAGKGAVFASRLDLDEKGGAVVDLLVAPVRESRGKPVISTQKALTELKAQAGERNEYSALQTSWADWCRAHLDQSIVRGTRREVTAREHLSPETYGAVMDQARAAVREAPQTLMATLARTELTHEDAEELGDYLLLKGEVARHKALGAAYEPPGALNRAEDVEVAVHLRDPRRGPWPVIEAIRAKANQVLNAAARFGLGYHELQGDRSYGLGRELFPRLEDRMRLSAVVAHCGAFCARIEATVKNLILGQAHGRAPVHERDCWPQGAAQELERHQRALGPAAPEVRAAKAHTAEAPAATLGAIKDRLAAVVARSAAQEAVHATPKPQPSLKDQAPTHGRRERGRDRGHAREDDDDAWGLSGALARRNRTPPLSPAPYPFSANPNQPQAPRWKARTGPLRFLL